MQTPRATVDRHAELDPGARERAVDDWTAGDEPDFVVRSGSRRRRITGGHGSSHAEAVTVAPTQAAHTARRTILVEGDVTPRRAVDEWLEDDLDILAVDDRRAAPEDRAVVADDRVDHEDGTDSAHADDVAWQDAHRARPDETPTPGEDRRTVTIKGRPERLHGGAPLREIERRRPATPPRERIGSRPDRIAMWAVALGFALILIAAASSKAQAATTLGDRTLEKGMQGRDVRHLQLRLTRLGFLDAPATARFGSLTERAVVRYQRSRCLEADGVVGASTVRALRGGRPACRRSATSRRAGASGGDRRRYRRVHLGTRTVARGMAGRDVRTVQRLLGVDATGVFGPITQRAVRRFQRRAGLGADGAVGPATRSALLRREMRVRKVTYFGPGLYGNRTACGQTLTKRLAGVAHRTLPCGTPVTLHHEGRFVTVTVVDRGPFVRGITYDLTAATARALGVRATTHLRAAATPR